MHPPMMYYADERTREMELAAAERQQGCSCSPFGRMISRAIKGRNGREGRRPRKEMFDYAMAYPPTQTYYVRPNARTITVTTSTNNDNHLHPGAISPEPTRTYAAVPGTATPPQAGAGNKPRKKKKKKKRVTFTPEVGAGPMAMPASAPPHHAGQYAPQHVGVASSSSAGGGATAASVYHHGGDQPYSPAAQPVHVHGAQGHPYGYGHGYGSGYGYGRYAPSPLTRREVVGTPRRHEYFSGEYRWYYPTPVRESIYSFATDRNYRLSNMFSEENPNACVIV